MSMLDPAPPVPPPIPPAITASRWRAIRIGGLGLAALLAVVMLRPADHGAETSSTATTEAAAPVAVEEPAASSSEPAAAPVEAAATVAADQDPAAIMRKNMPKPDTSGLSFGEFLNGPWVGEIEERPVSAGDRWRALFVWHRTPKDDADIIVHNTHAEAMQTFANLFGEGENPQLYDRATHHFDLKLPSDAKYAPRNFRCMMRPRLIVCGRVGPDDPVLVTLQFRAETTVAATEYLDNMMFAIASVEMLKNAKSVLGQLEYLDVLKVEAYKP